jgi:large subunit ribosomal protein L18Ae
LISVKRIFEKKNKSVKNYGIWIKYESRSGIVNMYKEYRDILTSGAVEQMYIEMAGRHKARWCSIVILRIEELNFKECIRTSIRQFHNPKIKFPVIRNIFRGDYNDTYSLFEAHRPRVVIKN